MTACTVTQMRRPSAHTATSRPSPPSDARPRVGPARQEKTAEASGAAQLRAALDAAQAEEADRVAAERRELSLLGQTEQSDKCGAARRGLRLLCVCVM